MRYLVAAGTRHYRAAPELPLVHEDVERATELFTSLGYRRILGSVSRDPAAEDVENALADWCRGPGLTSEDIVVVYYAGHGERGPAGQYRLACAGSEPGRPRSWLSLPNLAEILATSPVRNVLFIVDACHAAAATAEIASITNGIVAGRARGDDFGAGTWLLASARHRDLSEDGAFVAELAKACTRGDGPSQRHLAPSVLAERVNQAFIDTGRAQRAACSSVDQSEHPPFFPNAAFDPLAEIVPDGRTRGECEDLSTHFEPRGRGVEHVHDPGSYFTGRERALREARAHLSGQGPGGPLVVTADPGSGKSAVLGRLVLEGCADAALNARHQTLEALVGRVAAAADISAATPVALFTALARRERPFRIVVDSLDEAGPGGDKSEARRIAWELLRPLAAVACVRLLIGSRRELLPHLGDRVPVIDLDERAYTEDTDPAEYVEKILNEAGAPYAPCPMVARRVAHEVARRAGRCFLVARMTASALLRGPVVDTTVPGWAEQLPSDVGGAYEAYLQRLPAGRHAATTALLTALAFGEGNGLPRRIWVPVAARLSGMALVQADVDLLLREDGSYLAQGHQDGARYFRLYHQELTDHLRSRALKYRDLAEIQECFVDTLLESVPDRDWVRAQPYVRAHLATHAAGSGALDTLIEDASFVVACDPAGLLPALRQALRHPSRSMAVERYAYLILDNASEAGTDRAALLAFVARAYGQGELAERAERISASLRRICVEPRTITAHRVIGRHEGQAYSVSEISPNWLIRHVVLHDGSRVVLAAPPRASHVHVWQLDGPSRSTVLPHPAHVRSFAVVHNRWGRVEAITLDDEGTLRTWDVADQALIRKHPGTYRHLSDAGTLFDGTPVVVCDDEERVTVLALPALETVAEVERPAPVPLDRSPAAWLTQRDGQVCLLVCDQPQGRLTLHPLDEVGPGTVVLDQLTGASLADRVETPEGTVVAVSGTSLVTLLAVGSGKTTMFAQVDTRWRGRFAAGSSLDPVFVDKERGALLMQRLDAPLRRVTARRGVAGASLLAPLVYEGKVYAVVGGFTPVTVVDCATGKAVGSRLFGPEGAVCALRVLDWPDGSDPDILAVGNDGTARLWRWGAHEERLAQAASAGGFSGEVDALVPWPGARDAVVAVSAGYTRIAVPDSSGATPFGIVCRPLPEPSFSGVDIDECITGEDGTLDLVASRHTFMDNRAKAVDREQWGFRYVWAELLPPGEARLSDVQGVGGPGPRFSAHLLPPTGRRSRPRLVAFDALHGRVKLLDSPAGNPDWAGLPWSVNPLRDVCASAAFTSLSGEVTLVTVVRQADDWEFPIGTQHSSSRRAKDAPPPPDGETTGRLWVHTGDGWRAGDTLAVADGVQHLSPHHTGGGTRWLAQHAVGSSVSVIDLVTRRRHEVSPPLRAAARRIVPPGLGSLWTARPDRTPLLVCTVPVPYAKDPLARVVVWEADAPESPRELPVRAAGPLSTGHAPNGEVVVAVSDGQGVTLCHPQSGEKVWSAPLPALVSSLAFPPHSPHLDIAVGTQQGVVLLRPRLSRSWRERLGVG
ncbi:hypothetical protein BFF78_04620 [Streptomyces fodineus]|uniref:Peptidase C14 caspase domain-containing protein n=1 Tax=Streptomyces fodineus TaxID=1904616 RepID=A0A1D7Y503_9ACTN|nr:caspase family protein [Streptomyces fodineus]AOR30429.1 hypothetical protein BFF78_04620 [Streptomyces fodineus]